MFAPLRNHGRALVPVSVWYEWKKVAGDFRKLNVKFFFADVNWEIFHIDASREREIHK